MNIARLLLKILVAVLKLAKQYNIKGKDFQHIVELIDDACEVTHSNDCHTDELENKLSTCQEAELEVKVLRETIELNEEEFWRQRAKLHELVKQAMEATGVNNEFRHATRHVLEEIQTEFPNDKDYDSRNWNNYQEFLDFHADNKEAQDNG